MKKSDISKVSLSQVWAKPTHPSSSLGILAIKHVTLFERLQHMLFLSSHIPAFRGLVSDLSWPASVTSRVCSAGSLPVWSSWTPTLLYRVKKKNRLEHSSHLCIHKHSLTPMKQLPYKQRGAVFAWLRSCKRPPCQLKLMEKKSWSKM